MKRLLTLIIASIMLVGVISITFAGGVQEETFLEELEGKLVEEGFTDEEIADFMEAAEEIDWADAENSNPSVVAKSLVQLKRDNEGLEAREQARIAHSFATELEETEEEEEGDEVSQAAQQAVEELKGQIRQWQEDGEEEELGELVRNTVREQVQEASQEKKQNENQERPSEAPEDSSKGSEGDEADEASEEPEGTGDKGLDKADEKAPQSKSGK